MFKIPTKQLNQQYNPHPLPYPLQKTLDSYEKLVPPSSSILSTALIGLPDLTPTNTGTYSGVIFTPEEPLITSSAVESVLSWDGFKGDFKCVVCAPIGEYVNKEKKGNWIPVFNNDAKEEKMWNEFVNGVRGIHYEKFGEEGEDGGGGGVRGPWEW
jgi:hypothetical protein